MAAFITCSATLRADLQPSMSIGRVDSTRAGKVFLLMCPGDLGPFGADDAVASISDVDTSSKILRHSEASGRISLSVSESLAILRESSCNKWVLVRTSIGHQLTRPKLRPETKQFHLLVSKMA